MAPNIWFLSVIAGFHILTNAVEPDMTICQGSSKVINRYIEESLYRNSRYNDMAVKLLKDSLYRGKPNMHFLTAYIIYVLYNKICNEYQMIHKCNISSSQQCP